MTFVRNRYAITRCVKQFIVCCNNTAHIELVNTKSGTIILPEPRPTVSTNIPTADTNASSIAVLQCEAGNDEEELDVIIDCNLALSRSASDNFMTFTCDFDETIGTAVLAKHGGSEPVPAASVTPFGNSLEIRNPNPFNLKVEISHSYSSSASVIDVAQWKLDRQSCPSPIIKMKPMNERLEVIASDGSCHAGYDELEIDIGDDYVPQYKTNTRLDRLVLQRSESAPTQQKEKDLLINILAKNGFYTPTETKNELVDLTIY